MSSLASMTPSVDRVVHSLSPSPPHERGASIRQGEGLCQPMMAAKASTNGSGAASTPPVAGESEPSSYHPPLNHHHDPQSQHRRHPASSIPIVGGSGARLPTDLLNASGDVATDDDVKRNPPPRGRNALQPVGNGVLGTANTAVPSAPNPLLKAKQPKAEGRSSSATNGSADSAGASAGPSTHHSNVKREIDLTSDDDDITLVNVRGPGSTSTSREPAPQMKFEQTFASSNRDAEPICLGIIPAAVITVLGLPAIYINDHHNSDRRWKKDDWPAATGPDFFLEPGYRPIEITPSRTGARLQVHEVTTPWDVRARHPNAQGMEVKAFQPELVESSFGSLPDRFSRALYGWMVRRRIKLAGRMAIVPQQARLNSFQPIDLLCFCARKDANSIIMQLLGQGLKLFRPRYYSPSWFPGAPQLDVPVHHFPDAMQQWTLMDHMMPQQPQTQPQPYGALPHRAHPSPNYAFTMNGQAVHTSQFPQMHGNPSQYPPMPGMLPPSQPFQFQSRGTMLPTKEDTEQEKRKQVDSVYQSLPDGETLAEMEQDYTLIRTQLMSHQKRALTFLTDREATRSFERDGRNGKVVALWEPKWQGSRIMSYLNMVTQCQQGSRPQICRGALLADDMGLGKTLTTIALIASTAPESREWCKKPVLSDTVVPNRNSDDDDDDDEVKIEDFKLNMSGTSRPPAKRPRTNGKQPAKKSGKRAMRKDEAEKKRLDLIKVRSRATLLVLPLSLISTWQSQLREHWKPECQPKIYIHHGPNRMTDAARVARHNVVITTYSTLSSEYDTIAHDDDLSDTDQEGVEDEDYTEADHLLPFSQARALAKKKEKALKRKKAAERRKRKREEGHFPLQQIEWFRVVLDEAHSIKDPNTQQSRATCDLVARNRLALTGTPVQNRIDDLYALIKFLRLEPFSDRVVWNQYCAGRTSGLTLQTARAANADKANEPLDPVSLARVQTLMKFLTLRRTKDMKTSDGKPILELPPKFARVMELDFDDREMATYQEMRQQYKSDFDKMRRADTLKYNYATILHEISNLRMTCDHMELVEASKDRRRIKVAGLNEPGVVIQKDGISRDRAVVYFELLCSSDQAQCATCTHDLSNFVEETLSRGSSPGELGGEVEVKKPVLLRCLHLFCSDCAQQMMGPDLARNATFDDRFACSQCDEVIAPLTEMRTLEQGDLEKESGSNVLAHEKFGADIGVPIDKRSDYSTKIRALVEELESFSRSNRGSKLYDPTAPCLDQVAADATEKESGRDPVYIAQAAGHAAPIKSIVFSQWTTMLDRIARAVHRAGIKVARLDGRMGRPVREDHLERFKEDSSVEVLLVSLKAGGVGLNLVSACRAYLMEPYWNPAVENQGLDRVYRMGQQRAVVTTKYVINGSIELNMLELQKRKMELAESVGGKRRPPMTREQEIGLLLRDIPSRRPGAAVATAAGLSRTDNDRVEEGNSSETESERE